jgi:hypothetical protein
LLFNLSSEDARKEIERWAERHSRRGVNISSPLYDLWPDALCEAVAIHDPKSTGSLGEQWRAAMRPGKELIVGEY